MAAVVKWSNWCKLLPALLILVSLSFSAVAVNKDTTTRLTYLDVTGEGGVLYAKLSVMNVQTEIGHDQEKLSQAFREYQKGNVATAQQILQSAGLEQYFETISADTEPLSGVPVHFFYYEQSVGQDNKVVYTRTDVLGCSPSITNNDGIANCSLPLSVYNEKCTEVFASFGDPVYGAQETDLDYQFSQDSILACDPETTSLDVMSTAIKNALNDNMDQPLCLISVLMGGLLLASMFFAGRSPLSLLDITTPLLPKAKSISYSGITGGTGLSRIGKEMAALGPQGKLISAASKETIEDMLRHLRSKGGYNKALLDYIMRSKADDVLKMMAVRALLADKGRAFIDRILALHGKAIDDENYQKEYGKILSELQRASDARKLNEEKSLHDRAMLLSQMNIENQMQMKAFGEATGAVPTWLKNKFKYTDKLPLLGTHIRGAMASFFAAGRMAGRMYKATAAGIIRNVADAGTEPGKDSYSKRIHMAIADRKRNDLKPTLWQSFIARPGEVEKLAKPFDNYEYGSALYKRLMEGAKKDVLHWLVGSIVSHYGGKMDLTLEEMMQIGKKTPEELMFAKLKSKEFAEIEAKLRDLLSAEGMGDYKRAMELIKFMKANGIDFDSMGVIAALKQLKSIETEIPKDFIEGDYLNKDAIIESYKLERLQSYLREQFKVDQAIDLSAEYDGGRKFFFTVGRNTLTGTSSDYTFRTLFLPKYLEALSSKESGRGSPLSIMDVAKYSFLRVVNERWGVVDPDTPGLSSELKLVMQNAKQWLQSLVNQDKFKGDINNMSALLDALYISGKRGPEDLMDISGHGMEYGPQDMWRMDMKAHWRLFGGPMGGAKTSVEDEAYGEVNRSHMVAQSVQDLLSKAKAAGKSLTYEEATRAYLERVVSSHLMNRLKGIIEEPNPNVYFSSQAEFDRFRQQQAAFRSHIARLEGTPDERLVSDQKIEEYVRKTLSLDDISKSSWMRLKEGSLVPFVQEYVSKAAMGDRPINVKHYIRIGGYWEEFKPEKLAQTGAIRELLGKDSKLNKLIFGETSYLLKEAQIRGVSRQYTDEYSALMDSLKEAKSKALAGADLAKHKQSIDRFFASLSDMAIKNPKKAEACAAMISRLYSDNRDTLARIGYTNPDSIYESRLFKDSKFGEKVRLQLLVRDYQSASTPGEKDTAAKLLKQWASEGPDKEERHVKVALLFYQNADKTGDWRDFHGYREAIRLAPATMPIQNDPNHPPINNDAVGGARGFFKKMFNRISRPLDPLLTSANIGLESFLLSSFGKTTSSQYEGSLTSEYFRETGAKFVAKLAAGEFGNTMDRNNSTMQAYNKLADAFVRYHAIWDETITRDPRGNSSAIGSAFIYSSFFHHGPAMAFGPGPYTRWSSAGFQTPWTSLSGAWAHVKERLYGLQWAPQMFNWAVGAPMGVAYRTYITSRWGFMSKYDRRYKEAPAYAPSQRPEEYRQTVQQQYASLMQHYESNVALRERELINKGFNASDANAQARLELNNLKPTAPAFGMERDILHPFSETAPRTAEAKASLLNWIYASFDPYSTNPSRIAAIAAATPLFPVAQFIPSRWIQSKILGNGTPIMNRSDKNPYYISPQGMRAELIKAAGPMVKRRYGGTEMQVGVTRSHEDTWAYQAGVNAVWGNSNPGVSYVDFSGTLHMDPRAANYLRYESRFRPYMEEDDYVKKQANLGLVKRDIDPFKLIMERNRELRSYEFPQNTLFRFLSPATWLGYTGKAIVGKASRVGLSVRDLVRDTSTFVSTTRGSTVKVGAQYLASRAGEKIGDYAYNKLEIGLTKSIRYCPSCGGPMPEGSECRACTRKKRCDYCHEMVDPSGFHTCTHGLQRNLRKEEFEMDERQREELRRRYRWGRET